MSLFKSAPKNQKTAVAIEKMFVSAVENGRKKAVRKQQQSAAKMHLSLFIPIIIFSIPRIFIKSIF